MSNRRQILTGLVTLPLIGGNAALASTTDPFPGYHAEITAVHVALAADGREEDKERMMDRWAEIDGLALSTLPTTLPGAIACLEYARRERDGRPTPAELDVLARWSDAMGAYPDHVDRVVAHLLERERVGT